MDGIEHCPDCGGRAEAADQVVSIAIVCAVCGVSGPAYQKGVSYRGLTATQAAAKAWNKKASKRRIENGN